MARQTKQPEAEKTKAEPNEQTKQPEAGEDAQKSKVVKRIRTGKLSFVTLIEE